MSEHALGDLGGLAELHEVGFLLKESDESITIGTERAAPDDVSARMWLTIPKVNICEIRRTPLAKAFPAPRPKRAPKKTPEPPVAA